MNRKALVYKILALVFAVGFVIFGALYLKDRITEKKAENLYEDLAANTGSVSPNPSPVTTIAPTPTAAPVPTETDEEPTPTLVVSPIPTPELSPLEKLGIAIPEKQINFEQLKSETNSDIYAWIYIPNTNVDYPIVQSASSMDYYLNHNLDGSEGYPGCIYTQKLNTTSFEDVNTVIYGHNMKNGTMFNSLHNFEDFQFFDDNSYIYVYTENGPLVYKIYAAVCFSNMHILKKYNFKTLSGFSHFINDVDNSKSMYNQRRDMNITYEDKLITLSTCIQGDADHRYIVVGVLLDDKKALEILAEENNSEE